jgi:hypothetical protein
MSHLCLNSIPVFMLYLFRDYMRVKLKVQACIPVVPSCNWQGVTLKPSNKASGMQKSVTMRKPVWGQTAHALSCKASYAIKDNA